jgi:threonine/homoserine/homoserine lactone efflux protein
MEMLIPLGAIFGAILIGAISPGPSFVLVARTAIAVSRSAGMATAVGMGLGGLMFAGAVLLGLHSFPWCGVRGNGDDLAFSRGWPLDGH